MGKYLLRKELGRGGMGVVYLAEDTQLGRDVAVKMLRPGMAPSERFLERFRREARAVAALSHPNIVHLNAFDVVDDCLLIEMPYLTGGSLYEHLHEGMPFNRMMRLLIELLRALSCCHAAGIIHRDVKPGNVLFDANGSAKLSDFGAAALLQGTWEEGQERGATTTMFIGTPQYACPEAWSSEPPAPHWDLYALGMIVREALTGAPAVRASSPLEYLNKIVRQPPPPLGELDLPVSPEFAALIDRFTAIHAADRPATAAEALHALECLPEYAEYKGTAQDTVEGPVLFGSNTLPRPRAARRIPWRRVLRPLAFATALLAGAAAVSALTAVALRGGTPAPSTSAEVPPPVARDAANARHWHSAQDSRRAGWIVLRPDASGARVEAIGVLGRQLIRLDGAAGAAGEAVQLEGRWAEYADVAGTAPRFGRVEAVKSPGVGVLGGYTLDCTFTSETDPADWHDTLYVHDDSHPVPEEALLRPLEQDSPWPQLLFGELLPRDVEDRFRLPPFLFAREGALLLGGRATQDAAITPDARLDDPPWLERGWDVHAPTPQVAAIVTPGGLALAFSAPAPQDQALRIRLAVAPAERPSETRWANLEIDADGLRGAPGGQGLLRHDGTHAQAECWLPLAPANVAAWPQRDTAFRVNAVLVAADDPEAAPLAVWGSPTVERPNEGMLVLLNSARVQAR